MRKFLATCAVVSFFGLAGCSSSGSSDGAKPAKPISSPTTMMSGADACTHCAGMQMATADGKCPICGMKVSGR